MSRLIKISKKLMKEFHFWKNLIKPLIMEIGLSIINYLISDEFFHPLNQIQHKRE